MIYEDFSSSKNSLWWLYLCLVTIFMPSFSLLSSVFFVCIPSLFSLLFPLPHPLIHKVFGSSWDGNGSVNTDSESTYYMGSLFGMWWEMGTAKPQSLFLGGEILYLSPGHEWHGDACFERAINCTQWCGSQRSRGQRLRDFWWVFMKFSWF